MPVLSRPAYRRLWAARTVSQWGDIAQFTALSLLVFYLTVCTFPRPVSHRPSGLTGHHGGRD
jgi:hypothetical protein